MTNRPFERRSAAFIVRLWAESAAEEGEPEWRGQIEHVGSGEKAYFRDLAELLGHIDRRAPGFVSASGSEGELRGQPKKEDP
jgi:hypothetical protein